MAGMVSSALACGQTEPSQAVSLVVATWFQPKRRKTRFPGEKKGLLVRFLQVCAALDK